MFYSNYCSIVNNSIKIYEKIISNKISLKKVSNLLKIKHLEIILKIPSKSQYEHGFITMLMLTEKFTNSFPIFLLDKNTLSKKKTIKIGLVLTIKNEMIIYYLKMCCIHSIPKFNFYGIFFNFSNKHNIISYDFNKILSNTLFSFDKDINSYYDYLNELPYEFNFLFRSYFKNISINKLLVSNQSIYFINETNVFNNTHISEINEIVELDLLNEEEDSNDILLYESESEEEIQDVIENDYSDFLEFVEIDDFSNNNTDDNIDLNIFINNNKLDNFFYNNNGG